MEITRATAKNYTEIKRLIKMYPEKLMQFHLPKISRFFVAVEDNMVVGCCALEIYSKRLAEIRSLAVDKEFQGRGIAIELIKECLKFAKKKRILEVITITGANGLFERFGFGAFNKEKFALLKFMR